MFVQCVQCTVYVYVYKYVHVHVRMHMYMYIISTMHIFIHGYTYMYMLVGHFMSSQPTYAPHVPNLAQFFHIYWSLYEFTFPSFVCS